MTPIFLAVSVTVKVLSLVMLLYAFRAFSAEDVVSETGVFTQFYMIKRRYDLLRYSLLFVAAIVLLELGDMVYVLVKGPVSFPEAQMLLSDFIFLGLIILLSKIYSMRLRFPHHVRSKTQQAP